MRQTHADKTKEHKNQAVATHTSQKQGVGDSNFQFAPNRPEALAQRKLQEAINNSSQVNQLRKYQAMADHFTSKTAQQKENVEQKSLQGKSGPVQSKENNTGLPDHLKSGVEHLSGYSMDDVKVHYNSDKPFQFQALAYAQGTTIHVAPGQEKHLPHEAWHVVQQKQGRVQTTRQMKGNIHVNDDAGLEKEADVMGEKAAQVQVNHDADQPAPLKQMSSFSQQLPIQRRILIKGEPIEDYFKKKGTKIPENIRKDWLNDQYARDYKHLIEYFLHAGGQPVQVGLQKSLGIWYRLPLPSMYKVLSPSFFLLGELHHIFPVRLLVKESNQQSAHIISESAASFKNEAYGKDEKLEAREGKPTTHLVELGLAKALFAFASKFAPGKEDREGLRQSLSINRRRIGAPDTIVPKPKKQIAWGDGSVEAWEDEAGKHGALYRGPDGRPYFMLPEDDTTAYIRPNISEASGYSIGNATGNFLAQPEIIEALDPENTELYQKIVNEKLTRESGEYEDAYRKVFEALRDASKKNLKTVYPGIEGVIRGNPQKKPGVEQITDIELAMNHRNTAMMEAIKMAFRQGGYALASLGNQHVLDLLEFLSKKGELPFLIITYSDFINKYSVNAIMEKRIIPDTPEEAQNKEEQKPQSQISGPLPNPWLTHPSPDPLLIHFLTVSKMTSPEAKVLKWRLADQLVQKYGHNPEALQLGLDSQSTSDLIGLRTSYQTDIDLVLGYEGRVDEDIQLKVIKLIDDIIEARKANTPSPVIEPTIDRDIY